MTFRDRVKDRRRMVAFATSCLVIAIALPRIIHPTAHFGRGAIDGLDGLLFGLSIGLNLLVVMRAGRQRRCART